jgi:hypothetical protein
MEPTNSNDDFQNQPDVAAYTNAVVSDALEHAQLLYSGDINKFPSSFRPMVSLIQRLSNACRLLQAEMNLVLSQRDRPSRSWTATELRVRRFESGISFNASLIPALSNNFGRPAWLFRDFTFRGSLGSLKYDSRARRHSRQTVVRCT